ncbi:formate dehydrogenase accessory sulfurtransferase FdhD [Luteimonas sp. RD2P54]|uniref:Sulfur carrier protein FdhD n=1 Tax=Luteimonas endophytica TaxID=3042023 RepID=A0ABT6JC83_9GAMM|nr:formate dehydrogenase accessory sulfurtransferase FdhD [Luteimonas endophytica]MDH5824442.1 formate dehydrogenase accessory sulfurtransferase FdhD [Luteimonas endophytica]
MTLPKRPAVPIAAVPGSVLRTVERWHGSGRLRHGDHVAEEVPVALVCNGAPFAVMMATPADLEDFAIGFALSEGIVAAAADAAIEGVEERVEGMEVRLSIPAARAEALLQRRRTLPGRSGCGICGSELLETALRQPPPVAAGLRVEAAAVRRALRELAAAQALNALTGATHGAGWADAEGGLKLAREDIGRHNALDKLIGAMHRGGERPDRGFLVVTSRASYEMAMKAASAGIGLMAAMSAPTALAIAVAERARLTLLGFARDDGHAVYAHGWRLLDSGG